MLRKLLTIILSLMLCVGMAPTNAYAENGIVIDKMDISSIMYSCYRITELNTIVDGESFDDIYYGAISDYTRDSDFSAGVTNYFRAITVYEKNDLNSPLYSIWDQYDLNFHSDYSYTIDFVFKAKNGYKFACSEKNGVKLFDLSKIVSDIGGVDTPVDIDNLIATVHSDCIINPSINQGDDYGYPTCTNDGDQDNYLWIRMPFLFEGGSEQPTEVECSTWKEVWDSLNNIYDENASPDVYKTLKITLTEDIEATEEDLTLLVSDGMDVTLDLNGHVLNRNLIDVDGETKNRPDNESGSDPDYSRFNNSGSVIEVWGGKLTIVDSSPNTPHDGFVDNNNLWHLAGNGHPIAGEKTKTIKGGIITGGIGMVCDDSNIGTYQFGGYFQNKEVGGGILIANSHNAIVTLEGGSICGNLAADNGGGVAILSVDFMTDYDPSKGGYYIIHEDKSKFIMNGGNICNNYVSYEDPGEYPCTYSYESPTTYLDERRGGGGIFAFQGDVEINGGHVDENLSKHFAGGILGYGNAEIKITSGTINNNIGRIAGAIWNYIGTQDAPAGRNFFDESHSLAEGNSNISEDLLLTADEGKEIVITGNKSKERGNVYSNNLYLSGKVIIKDNTCENYVVVIEDGSPDGYIFPGLVSSALPDVNGKLPAKDEEGYSVTKAYGHDIMYVMSDYIYDGNFHYTMYQNGTMSLINIIGDLTGSDINVSIIGADVHYVEDVSQTDGKLLCLQELTNGYLDNNPGAEVDDFIHYNGPDTFSLVYDDYCENEIIVKPRMQVKYVEGDENFTSALEEAEALYESDPDATYKMKLSSNIGSVDEPLEEMHTSPNVDFEMNGNDIYVEKTIVIEGELVDSGKDTGDGNIVKGKIYLNKPDDFIYNSVIEAEEDDDTRQEPVWTQITDGELNGYYCMYQVGAKTKWAEIEGGDNDDEAKFKVQPAAYDDLFELLNDDKYKDVYGTEKKVKVGLRLILDHSRDVNFVFSDNLTNTWANGSPKVNCMIVTVKGLKPFKSVLGQAAIYSKPLDDKDSELINAQFFSNDNDRSAK